MNAWKNDKKWSDQFVPEIKSILGQVLICESPELEDQQRNTDLMVFTLSNVRIGCRIRRAAPEYFPKYKNEFTIRCDRPSGISTELDKILAGWGNFFFYGFGENVEQNGKLLQWFVGDYEVFRDWLSTTGKSKGVCMRNRDGSSYFRVYSLIDLPYAFMIANSRVGIRFPIGKK